jgi:hypothetical protein
MIKSAAALLKKVSAEGGTIVHTRICHPIEVEKAKQRGDYLEDRDDEGGGGFVRRPMNDFALHYGEPDGDEAGIAPSPESDEETEGDPKEEPSLRGAERACGNQ